MANVRRSRLGKYSLPTRAINALSDEGIDETNIDDFTIDELSGVTGFGGIAVKMLRKQRARNKAAKRRAARTRKEKQVRAAENIRLTEESDNGYAGEGRDPSRNTRHWLDIDTPREASKTLRLPDDRLVLDIGEEHGLGPRHMRWMEDFVRNAPPDLLIDSIERLIVVLVRKGYAGDPSKGGRASRRDIQGSEVVESNVPELRL